MTHTEALKLAYDETWSAGSEYPIPSFDDVMSFANKLEAIKEALAQPEQEPVITDWNAVHEKLELVWYRELSADEGLDEIQDLIDITPPQRKPLTEFERMQIIGQEFPLPLVQSIVIQKIDSVCKAIEAAHGIKENT